MEKYSKATATIIGDAMPSRESGGVLAVSLDGMLSRK
jgi:hypothetical protein